MEEEEEDLDRVEIDIKQRLSQRSSAGCVRNRYRLLDAIKFDH